MKRAIALTRVFEPALARFVAPSRIAHFEGDRYDVKRPNRYCRQVSSVFSADVLARVRLLEGLRRIAEADEARFVTFNVRPLAHIHTVEVRMHNGTLEARKILLWTSLWQQILWAAAHRTAIESVDDVEVIVPDGDIVELARMYLADARQPQQQLLVQRLVARRAEIVDQWRRVPELASWVEASRRWSNP